MAQRKSPYQKKTFESDRSSNDTSANIFMSMLLHPAWIDLTARQKCLYMYCKAQYYGQSGSRSADRTDNTKFYFNRGLWLDVYQIYKTGNESAFYKDINALISHGFIICCENGKTTRTKSIYQYSSKWQQWGSAEFKILPSEMTSSMLKAYRNDNKE